MSSLMRQEAAEAPALVARQLAANEGLARDLAGRLRAAPPRFVATGARGSSDTAALYAKYLIEIALGLPVASIGPSVASVYGVRPQLAHSLFIAVSQSGRSPDLLDLAEAARAGGALTLAVVNDPASPLAERCELVLPVRAGREASVAATKSWIGSLTVLLQLVACWSGAPELEAAVARLPEDLAAAAAADWGAAESLLAAASSLFVVGRGPGFPAAQECALKLKETAALHAEAYSAAELMHGPLTLAGADFPVLALSQQDASLPGLVALLDQLAGRGVPLAVAGPAARGGALALPLATGLHPMAAPIAAVQSFYPLADAVARARGRDPDRPPHLSKVTETR
jgi:glucosamine--fructose-6-phosphate aminotransferase (isomerizing)